MLLYSDALTETPNEQGHSVEQAELLEMVAASLADAQKGAETPLTALLERFRNDRTTPTDDLTMVWLDRL